MRIFNRNSEGYADPTAGEAFLNINRELRAKRYQEEQERKKEAELAEKKRRRTETQQMLRRLDETHGWKLNWTNPEPANAIKQRKARYEKNPCND